jgi:hypothetical protein
VHKKIHSNQCSNTIKIFLFFIFIFVVVYFDFYIYKYMLHIYISYLILHVYTYYIHIRIYSILGPLTINATSHVSSHHLHSVQNLSNLFLKLFTDSACTTNSDKLFQLFIILWLKKLLLIFKFDLALTSL